MPLNVKRLINACGGPVKVEALLKRNRSAVCLKAVEKWIERDSMPGVRIAALIQAVNKERANAALPLIRFEDFLTEET